MSEELGEVIVDLTCYTVNEVKRLEKDVEKDYDALYHRWERLNKDVVDIKRRLIELEEIHVEKKKKPSKKNHRCPHCAEMFDGRGFPRHVEICKIKQKEKREDKEKLATRLSPENVGINKEQIMDIEQQKADAHHRFVTSGRDEGERL